MTGSCISDDFASGHEFQATIARRWMRWDGGLVVGTEVDQQPYHTLRISCGLLVATRDPQCRGDIHGAVGATSGSYWCPVQAPLFYPRLHMVSKMLSRKPDQLTLGQLCMDSS